MSGAPSCSTSSGGGSACRPMRRDQFGAGADDARRPGQRRPHRFAQRRNARRHERAPAGAEHLQIDVIVPRIDRRHHGGGVVLGDVRRREAGQRRQADGRLAGGERDAARRRDADAQAGEAAGPGGDRDAVELARIRRRPGPSRARSAASSLRHGRAPSAASRSRSPRHGAVSSTAAEQAASAVSMARTRMA